MKKQLLNMTYTFILIFISMFSASINAQIIYTDIPDSVRTGSYNLDLNNDGISDFSITHSSLFVSSPCPGAKSNNYIKVTPFGNNQILNYTTTIVAKLGVATLIDSSNLTWVSTSNQLMSRMIWRCAPGGPHMLSRWNGTSGGKWYNAIDGYLGVKLKKNGNTYYGWVRISTSAANSFTVKDFAYDSTPNHSILTGKTTGARISEEDIVNKNDFSLVMYPNPLSSSATISFSLSQSEKVSLKIFDMNGQFVSILADNFFEAGENELVWSTDEVSNGVYFLQFQTEKYFQKIKLIVTK